MDPWTVLRPAAVLVGALLLTAVVGFLVDRLLGQVARRHPDAVVWPQLRRCRPPLQAFAATALLLAWEPLARLGDPPRGAVRHVLLLLTIGLGAWLAARVATAVEDAAYHRFQLANTDSYKVRRVRTQVAVIRRVTVAAIIVIAVAAMMMTFPAARTIGTSLLASAGIIGLVAGVAAQSTLGNLFAGLQIAFSDMVRIGDVVVVDGEWGNVEELSLTNLVVRTWDQRRIVMPVSYFTSKPFENWSRTDPNMTGTVIFHLDHSAPIAEMREELFRIVKESPHWDGEAWGLVVVDTTPSTIVVRALMTAADADAIWTLRCDVRERLLTFLTREHPYALPRLQLSGHPSGPSVPLPAQATGSTAEAAAGAEGGAGDGADSGDGAADAERPSQAEMAAQFARVSALASFAKPNDRDGDGRRRR
ncbi:mechanosensitive ion channel family protein [Allostreptomyces psammosilenae]|uniref:Small-conductance mechanosensitive channel n=1 Tax=Allostreptomyces psammosilenae TaxID=1892865 RepID=A0A853A2K8_9ACTN|nr:mechanosensitive ion channel domain-containing protein [Allostreptomyces psammosilenae]NYI07114.1 small-conductance mechanosensitive channel [Allostreptomyces psammosilenae]